MSSFSNVQRKRRCRGAEAFKQQHAGGSAQGFPGRQPEVTFGLQKNDCQGANVMTRLQTSPGYHERAQTGDPGMGEECVTNR